MTKKFVREATIKLVIKISATVLFFDALSLILTLGEEFFLDLDNMGPLLISYSAISHLTLIFLQLGSITSLFIRWYIRYYTVGETHITRRTGLIVKRDQVVNFSNVRMVKYKQGIMGRLFNYGDITFQLVGNGEDFIIRGIDSPQEIVEKVEQNIRPA